MEELIIQTVWCIAVIYIASIPGIIAERKRMREIKRIYKLLDRRLPIPMHKFSEDEMLERAMDEWEDIEA